MSEDNQNENALITDTLSKIQSEPVQEEIDADQDDNDTELKPKESSTETSDTHKDKSTKKEKKKLGKGPKIAIGVIALIIAYGEISKLSKNDDTKKLSSSNTTEEVETETKITDTSDSDNNQNSSVVDTALVQSTPQLSEEVTNNTNKSAGNIDLSNITEKVDLTKNVKQPELNTDEESSFSVQENETSNKELVELYSELNDLDEFPAMEVQSQEVSMGSVVSQDDINELSRKNKDLEGKVLALTDELERLSRNAIKRLAILESEVSKKTYDTSYEKDRPAIEDLIISMPTSECESCVVHAEWMHQGILIQKANNSKWLAFDVIIKGDRLTLRNNNGSYDFWSTKRPY